MTAFIVCFVALLALSTHHAVEAFTVPRAVTVASDLQNRPCTSVSSSPNDDWGLEDSGEEDPRVDAMRSMLESSWDGATMGVVPSDSEKAAEAASESIADAMARSNNVMMIDLRLPSYDITEGSKLYDAVAAYDFCAYLSDKLRERKLIRKSLVLVRNEKERAEIDRVVSQRDGQTTSKTDDDDIGEDSGWESVGDSEGSDVDDFRKKLMTSWDGDDTAAIGGSSIEPAPSPAPRKTPTPKSDSSNRLWSMVGSEEISSGPDMFNDVIAAVDANAILSSDEDAMIILSPYDTADVIGLRRIMARYGQTRTIIIVNSRIEALPRELDPAVLVYGVLPLIARSRKSDESDSGLKAVVMKRFPADWAVYVDIGDGFVEAIGSQPVIDSSDKMFPSPEWIAQRVQTYVEGLPKQ